MKKDPYFKFLAATVLFGVFLAFASLSTSTGKNTRVESTAVQGSMALLLKN